MGLEVITDEAAVRGIADEWDDLFGRSATASPYLSRAWAMPWWRHFGGDRGPGPLAGRSRLHLVAVRDRSRLVALAPWLMTEVGLGPARLRTVIGIGQENADYGGVLLGEDPGSGADALLDHLEQHVVDRRTIVNCTRLAPGDPWLLALRDRFGAGAVHAIESEAYPRLDLAASADPVRTVSRLLKANDVRRRWRRLDESGGASFSYHRPPFMAEDLATFLDLHAKRWAVKDGHPAMIFGPAGRGFISDAAAELESAGLLRLSLVRCGVEPVAGRFGLEHRGVYYGLQSAWDPAFAPFGPGHLIVGKILERGAAEGLEAFDFMRGAQDHKAAWTAESRDVSYWALRPRGLGAVARRGLSATLALRARRRAAGGAR